MQHSFTSNVFAYQHYTLAYTCFTSVMSSFDTYQYSFIIQFWFSLTYEISDILQDAKGSQFLLKMILHV